MTDSTTVYPAEAIGHPEWRPGEHHHHDRHHRMKRFSWQPVLAGLAAGLAVQIVLSLFGMAIGLGEVSMTNPNAAPSATTVTFASSMWAGVSLLSGLFYGGFIAARLSRSSCHHEGILHGVVVWAVTVTILVCLLSSAAGAVFGGAAKLIGSTAQGAGAQMAQANAMDPDSFERQVRDMVNGVSTPPSSMSPDQVQADMMAQLGVLAAGGDGVPAAHQRLVADLQTQNVNAADAESRVTDWQTKADAARQKAKQDADKAAHAAAKTAVAAGVVLLLGLLTSALGGSLGALHVKHRREQHEAKDRGVATP